MSIKSHQLELSVSPITTSSVEEISERCCVINVYIYNDDDDDDDDDELFLWYG